MLTFVLTQPLREHTHTHIHFKHTVLFSLPLSLSPSFHADRGKETRARKSECEGKEERLTSTSATYSTDRYSSRDEVLRKNEKRRQQ